MSTCCGANGCLYWTLHHDSEAKEFAKIQPAFKAFGLDLKTLKHTTANVAVLLPDKTRDSRDEAIAMRLLDQDVDADTVIKAEAKTYPTVIDLNKNAAKDINLPTTFAKPGEGWQIATLLGDKNKQHTEQGMPYALCLSYIASIHNAKFQLNNRCTYQNFCSTIST